MKKLPLISIIFSTFLLTGCFMQPVDAPEICRYQLNICAPTIPIPKVFQAATRRARSRAAECTMKYMSSETSAQQSCSLKDEGYSLMVKMPYAAALYNTTNMIYSQCIYTQSISSCDAARDVPLCLNKVSRFAKNQWAQTPPQMLLPVIIQSLRNTHHFQSVVGFPSIVGADYRLDTSIICFRQEFKGCKSWVHITVDAAIIAARTQKIIATRRIDVIRPTICPTPVAGVQAYQEACNQMLVQLMYFCCKHGISINR
jgi:hypothetical protein